MKAKNNPLERKMNIIRPYARNFPYVVVHNMSCYGLHVTLIEQLKKGNNFKFIKKVKYINLN